MAEVSLSKKTAPKLHFSVVYTLILPCLVSLFAVSVAGQPQTSSFRQKNTIFVVLLARNKAHTLPYFLTQLQKLDYPKSRMALWIRSDHNVDNTLEVLQAWVDNVTSLYHSVNFKYKKSPPKKHDDESGPLHWSNKRFRHMIKLKEDAMEAARKMWSDYIWFVDCDVFLTNNQTLNLLIAENKTLVGPMLESLGAYSNYWCGMKADYYYQRTDDYMPILERKKVGCFEVPMIHSCILLDLRDEDSVSLTFDPAKQTNYNGPTDDIISFAVSAKFSGVKMHVSNTKPYGFIMFPQESNKQLEDDYEQLISVKTEITVESEPLQVSSPLSKFLKEVPRDKLGFDEVYMINLARRPERRLKMMSLFNELGILVKTLDAVDGRELNASSLQQLGVKMLPEYADPYHKRPVTMGEIGCFLSHYNVWKEVVSKGHRTAIVFEDDIRFEPYFRRKLENLMYEMEKLNVQWDLVYLGRKRLVEQDEPFVSGATSLVSVGYSYWTLCYMITLEGAKKLMGADPLSKLVPVDEFLPIMFDRHPEVTWKGYYKERNLKAFSAAPLLVYPTHYTGEKDYISDTEDSSMVVENIKDEL